MRSSLPHATAAHFPRDRFAMTQQRPRKQNPRAGSRLRTLPKPSSRKADLDKLAADEQEIQRLHRFIRQKLTEIEQIYRYSPVGLVLMDRDYRFVRINERMAEINGLPVEAHIGRTLREVLPDIADRVLELYRPVYERGEPVLDVEIRRRLPKEPDVERYYLANFFPFRGDNGDVNGLIGAVVDITDRKLHEVELRENERRFRTFFDSVTDAIFVVDVAERKFIDVNQRAVDAFGYDRAELLTKSIGDISLNEPPYTQAEANEHIRTALTGVTQTVEWRCRRRDGSLFWAEIGFTRATFGGRDLIFSTLRDITRRKEAEDRLVKLAQFDALTGLPNRRAFVAALERAIADGRRRGSRVAVLYLDLDHFKDVNDTLGHPAGDRLLEAVAQRLVGNLRASDLVARFGGDEFAVLISNLPDPSDAGIMARKLIDATALPFPVDANEIYTGLSVGIAVSEPNEDAESMLSHADVALYRAKAEGRRTYRFFDEAMDSEVRGRVSLLAELREAIAKQQFFLVYQPQVDIASGTILGVEALLRWRHPKRGVVKPKTFIPEAERSGLIMTLGNWALAQACNQARSWLDEGIAPGYVSVNVSALQIRAPREWEKSITKILAETHLPPHLLGVELTETALMATTPPHRDVLKRLRRKGLRVAIDDFGTGYSSLSYLRRYPVDQIKLAREFIVDPAFDQGDPAIVQAVIGLARLLNMEMVAEGVESKQQLELLASWGCKAAQGFYFGKPMSANEIGELLRHERQKIHAAKGAPDIRGIESLELARH
jgi:diguanylate cyclase (GGDEF)-like protein/PAS domain S-box-containing protein